MSTQHRAPGTQHLAQSTGQKLAGKTTGHPIVLCYVLSAMCSVLSGCAVFTKLELPKAPAGEQVPASVLDDGYEEAAGVIHVHTNYSHDADGTFEDVVRVANAQGLDYVIITEHNHLKPLQEGKQGWHGTTLVLIGEELSTRNGHYLALNVTQEVDRAGRSAQAIIDDVNRQGGLGFIAHPYFKKARWTDWSVRGFTGVEIYNVAHDTLDENKGRLVLWTLTTPAEPFYYSILDRPYDPLSSWDALIRRHGRAVGIGSTDAHEVHVLWLKFAPYEVMFQLARTHLLIPARPFTPSAVYEALRQGHAYVGIPLVSASKGFGFYVSDGTRVLGIMGDEASFQPNLQLTASLPAPADLTLLKDGQIVATTTAHVWQLPVPEPGVYRIEAMRFGKPWIFSNPIYIKPSEQPDIRQEP